MFFVLSIFATIVFYWVMSRDIERAQMARIELAKIIGSVQNVTGIKDELSTDSLEERQVSFQEMNRMMKASTGDLTLQRGIAVQQLCLIGGYIAFVALVLFRT